MPIIAPISRDERRLMQKAIHKTHDKNYARRLTAMLMLHRGRPCQRRCQNALL
ncbi:putative transposase, partial [Shigella boydii 965-58]